MEREILNFNVGWLYSPADNEAAASPDFDDGGFERVSLPHANTLLTAHKGPGFDAQIASYRFVSWYRRRFALGALAEGRRAVIEFGAVATVADVYVNGAHVCTHKGAYTGFSCDVTAHLRRGGNVIAVRVDSTRRPDVPPEGGAVDYCLFGGIVRGARLILTAPAYIEDAFVTTPQATAEAGRAEALVRVKNGCGEEKTLTVEMTLEDAEGAAVAKAARTLRVAAGETARLALGGDVEAPRLWSPDDPYLYTAKTRLLCGEEPLDGVSSRVGFRAFFFGEDGLRLNGEKIKLVGVNRHEQWPWIGRAAPDRQQRADADLIRDTGFNAVRCSHYPQSPAFLDRCDELGLIVFEEAPGWQHIGDEAWKDVYRENIREMILRDRNHACIFSWGTRVNESEDDDALYAETNRIAKALDPTRPTHGVRRMEFYESSRFLGGEDLFTVNYTYPENPRVTPYIVTEHSMDWYDGRGFSWASDADALKFTRSFAEPVDYYFGSARCAGGFAWSLFDYNNEVNYTRTDNVFYSGLYDIFRIAKMPSYFYRAQKRPQDGAIVYIANYRTPTSPEDVTVFSNCDEVELFADGASLGRQRPSLYMRLPHPLFVFEGVPAGAALLAVGYIGGRQAASHAVEAPGKPARLLLKPQFGALTADGADFASVEIYAVDARGAVAPYADNRVTVSVSGCGRFIGERTIALEGGSAAFLVQSRFGETGVATARAEAEGLEPAACEIRVEPFSERTVPTGEEREEQGKR